MNDDSVGYCKPPMHTRFRKGICPNPAGRGARKTQAAGPLEAFLRTELPFREGGKHKRATPDELTVRRLVASALGGNVADAACLLKLRKHVTRDEGAPLVIRVTGGLPQDET